MKTTLLRKLRQHAINVRYDYNTEAIYVSYWTFNNTIQFTRIDFHDGNDDFDAAIFRIALQTLGLLEYANLRLLRRRTVKARRKRYAARLASIPVKFEFKHYGE